MHSPFWQKISVSSTTREVELAALTRGQLDEWLLCYREMLKKKGEPKKSRREKSRKILHHVTLFWQS